MDNDLPTANENNYNLHNNNNSSCNSSNSNIQNIRNSSGGDDGGSGNDDGEASVAMSDDSEPRVQCSGWFQDSDLQIFSGEIYYFFLKQLFCSYLDIIMFI